MTGTGSRSALSVGAGIFLSRITGFLRDVVIASFFGTSLAAGAYTAALKIPNVLRNLLGEGTLSASFIPVYSAFLGANDREAARRLARAMLGLLLLVAGLLSGLGVLLAPWLTRLVAPGFEPEATALTTDLVRILFPMAGVMILAAWALGVLNSHRRFFLPFAAPVLWNLAQIAGLLLGAALGWDRLIYVLAWSTLAGSFLQFGVQLPTIWRLVRSLAPTLERTWEPVRRVIRNAGPVVASQGITQISSFLDVFLASFIGHAAVAGLGYAQRLAYLPLSLFGTSIAAASLPEMSRDAGLGEEARKALTGQLAVGFFRIVYFVLPSALLFLLFGDLVVRVVYERGQFGPESTRLVGWILGAYAVGLLASSSSRLFAAGFHALQDTRTPMRIAATAVGTGSASGAALMFWLAARGVGDLAAAGLVLGGALGAWLNLGLLWRGLRLRLGPLFAAGSASRMLRLLLAAGVGGTAGLLARRWLAGVLPERGFVPVSIVLAGTLLATGVSYLLIAGSPARVADRPDARRPDPGP